MSDGPAPETAPELHPALEHLAFLVGTWRGIGVVGYPTIEGANYEQELVWEHDGRPFLRYSSRTWLLDDDGSRRRAAAQESGFWRPGKNPRDVEVVLAHPTGIVEVYVGEVAFTKLELVTDAVVRTETAKEVTGLRRLYGLLPQQDGRTDRELGYAVDMAAVGQKLQSHLSARLTRDPDPV